VQTGASSLTASQAQAYLHLIEAFAGELEIATGAIIAGMLPTLEESVARQQNECAKLIAWTELMAARRSQEDVPAPLDTELADRVLAASNILLKLNRRYSALLKHSGETLRLLAGLSPSYHGQMDSSKLHTWSCDL
jgi:hypothetical protein